MVTRRFGIILLRRIVIEGNCVLTLIKMLISKVINLIEGINKLKIIIFRIAYKANVDDPRESPSITMIKAFEMKSIRI